MIKYLKNCYLMPDVKLTDLISGVGLDDSATILEQELE